MGKYKTTVGSSVTRLFDSEDTYSDKNAVVNVIFQHEKSHNRNLTNAAISGLASKIRRFQSYGENEYTYGLPDGFNTNVAYLIPDVEDAIESDEGIDIDLLTYYLASPDAMFFASQYAQRNWGLRDNGHLSNPPYGSHSGLTNYITDASFDMYGRLSIVVAAQRPGGYPYIIDYYTYDITDYEVDTRGDYYHCTWKPAGVTDVTTQYWWYQAGEGRHPALDLASDDVHNSPYLPIVPLREDNINLGKEYNDNGDLISTPDTELYRTSKYLLDVLGISFDDVNKSLASNPNVDDVDNAYVMFGIDIRPTRATSKFYLYQYFKDLSLRNIPTQPGSPSYPGAPDIPPMYGIEIKDAKYRMALEWSELTTQILNGTITDKTVLTYEGNTLTIEHRLTNSTYERIIVKNLSHYNYVYKNHNVNTTLEDSGELNDYGERENFNFIIPLNYELSRTGRSMFDREDMYRDSCKIICNSWERRRVKWYETSLFKVFLFIIIVVYMVWSGDFVNGVKALLAMTAAEVILYSLVYLAIGQLIKLGVQKLVEELGSEWAFLAAIAVVAASIIWPNALAGLQAVGMTSAQGFLALQNGIIEGIQEYTQDALGDLADEQAKWLEESSELEQELTDLEDSLNLDSALDIWGFVGNRMLFIPYERPEDYYNRTIHTGNIGTASLLEVENFVDNKVMLPKLNLEMRNS